MKRKFAAFLLILSLMLVLPLAASAETLNGGSDWTVTFTTANRMVSNFGETAIDDTLRNMQPGDTANFKVTVLNSGGKTIDWYLQNSVIKSLEDSSEASGGAYSYILTYTTSAGSSRELYNSNTVGGENSATSGAGEGLKEINSTELKDWIFLEEMATGRSGVVNLQVKLEGESQGNSYQDTMADIRLKFAAEVVPTRTIVRTGDEGTELKPLYLGMAGAGVLSLLLAVDGAVQNKKKRRQKT